MERGAPVLARPEDAAERPLKRGWLTFALGLLAGAVLAGTVASASFGRLSLQLGPLPGTSVNQPAAGSVATEGTWQSRQ